MQYGFYFDQSRCTGCSTCLIACKDWHEYDLGSEPANWINITTIEKGRFPNLFVAYLAQPCYHCAEPVCSWVCPAEAITRREGNGVVVVDREKCRDDSRCGIISEEAMGPTFSFGEGEAPCQIACPAHLSIPGYIALIAKGKLKEALDLIRQRMPLPVVCGRVCLAPCEKECRRQELDQPIAIEALKRFVTEHVVNELPSPLPRTKSEKVAIVGSGPTGLAAAYDLIRMGYGVTIYESSPVAGGWLATGIPPHRLPKEALKRDIDYIKALGVQIEINASIGKRLTLNDLSRRGYQATLLAIGAQGGERLKIPGGDFEGVLIATSFMRDFNIGEKVQVGNRVVVVGGGNVAIDCARTALRLGAVKVHLACLERREDMPAAASEIEEAEEEGITIHPSLTFTRILNEGGKVNGVECLRVEGVEFDEDGQPHIDVIEGSKHVLSADMVIFAVGQTPDLSNLTEDGLIDTTRRGTIAVDPETLLTSYPGVFAAGDAVLGPTSVIEAIAHGQKAAFYIDRYLQGDVLKVRQLKAIKASDIKVQIPTDVQKQERQCMPLLPVAERIGKFSEVALGFTPEMAAAEAKRCLNCAGHLCKDVCPYNVPQFSYDKKAKMQKCDLCLDRWIEGKKPICVEACPMRALDVGPLDELKTEYGDIQIAEGFIYFEKVKPSIVFKLRR